ncbi:alpha-ketoglutarate-dependent dioxygenase AlkB family protein [Dyella caseinilytica]|uniref:Alpha-ketoglutarate-dependent dioxygenase AlkB n=1 Tax=Dyella caseinilytica TaxID=1849581 RepID=A0ABX7GT57_9GAMM|nr:alpha-ketoglutarate-dependent dioxygenase AlkB [Dyella caseinilytica]QRN53064.1 alpha-ketoglutarate-dependent dioxygenase AlkB [Dyella caseinilytica]GGA11151.1 DNA methylase [Dyella caseinilytica]
MLATINEADGWQSLPLAGAEVRYAASWLDGDEADALFERLQHEIPWERHRLYMFGREVDSPRLSCWIGDPGTAYTYSRSRFEPNPWTASLLPLRERVQTFCGAHFNSVLANLYRDGQDSMGWHSDDEPELGPHPVIASLSLGAERRFRLRRKARHDERVTPLGLPLAHGSLLCMAGDTQRHYQHDLPRVAGVLGARINLTFRFIHARP